MRYDGVYRKGFLIFTIQKKKTNTLIQKTPYHPKHSQKKKGEENKKE